jgi:hypothetical protein
MAKGKRTKGQTTQWPKEKGQKDRKDRATRIPLKTGVNSDAPEG